MLSAVLAGDIGDTAPVVYCSYKNTFTSYMMCRRYRRGKQTHLKLVSVKMGVVGVEVEEGLKAL